MKVNVSKKLNKFAIKVKKHSPEICIILGVGGVVVSTVMACKATTKAETIVAEAKETLNIIHAGQETGEISEEEYTQEDAKKDKAILYLQTGIKVVKVYVPAIMVGTASLTAIIASNRILTKRNVALTAAYATINKSFEEYRSRVIEKYGEEAEKEIRYGIKAKKIETTETDAETGKEKKVKKTVNVVDPNLASPYAFYFDKTNPNYKDIYEYNEMFLRSQESYANDLLNARGYVFLNDVLDSLDIPRTKEGQIVGWTTDGEDGYINFRMQEVERETEEGTIEAAILLDFNVEGSVLEKI